MNSKYSCNEKQRGGKLDVWVKFTSHEITLTFFSKGFARLGLRGFSQGLMGIKPDEGDMLLGPKLHVWGRLIGLTPREGVLYTHPSPLWE